MEYYEHPDYKEPNRYTFGIEGTKEYIVRNDSNWMMHHREDGPAVDCPENGKMWFLNGIEVDPEEIVDLWLLRNIYCIYNPETDSLEFE